MEVVPTGSKRWRYRYRFERLPKMISFGLYSKVSLEEARRQRTEARRLLASGIDPSAHRGAQRLAIARTFERVGRQWLALLQQYLQQKRLSSNSVYRSTWLLENHLFPTLGARPITEITAHELLQTLEPLELAGQLDTARRAKQKFGQVMRFAIGLGYADRDISLLLERIARVSRHETPCRNH